MKQLLFIACLMVAQSYTIFSGTSEVDGISIAMEGEILIATSDIPTDYIVKIEVYNTSGQYITGRRCIGQSTTCSMDLSNIESGFYIAKAWSLQFTASKQIFVP